MNDIGNMAISLEASRIADKIHDSGYFKNKSDVLTFAAGFKNKKYYQPRNNKYEANLNKLHKEMKEGK